MKINQSQHDFKPFNFTEINCNFTLTSMTQLHTHINDIYSMNKHMHSSVYKWQQKIGGSVCALYSSADRVHRHPFIR